MNKYFESGVFRYYAGSASAAETIELNITRSQKYITTCVINVQLLLDGIKAFPCGNGNGLTIECGLYMECLRFLAAARAHLLEGEAVKSMEGWQESGLRMFDDYCKPGDKVAEDLPDYFANVVPPATLTSSMVQSGEPYSFATDDSGTFHPTYLTFHRAYEGWVFDGYCFKNGIVNMRQSGGRVEELMKAEAARAERAVEQAQRESVQKVQQGAC